MRGGGSEGERRGPGFQKTADICGFRHVGKQCFRDGANFRFCIHGMSGTTCSSEGARLIVVKSVQSVDVHFGFHQCAFLFSFEEK